MRRGAGGRRGRVRRRDSGGAWAGDEGDAALVKAVYDYFADDPHAFEACAIELWSMQAKESVSCVATRRSVDGAGTPTGGTTSVPDTDRIRVPCCRGTHSASEAAS